ncbi:MAG: exosome complex RNA-binding protein Rrp4 [Nanoarchaeota archaeon]
MTKTDDIKKIVIPGELIAEGDDYLPGEGTIKQDNGIVAMKYGIAEEQNKLVRVIALSGVYNPRRGNVIIGKVENVTFNGWIVDIGSSDKCFLNITEISRYVNQDDLDSVMGIGDVVIAKILRLTKRGIDLTTKSRGLGKVDQGLIIKINPNKVPRVIGKEGSMINLIKENTGCNITVGQNGLILIEGESIEKELVAKKAILFVTEHATINGLTDKLKEWFEKENDKI